MDMVHLHEISYVIIVRKYWTMNNDSKTGQIMFIQNLNKFKFINRLEKYQE